MTSSLASPITRDEITVRFVEATDTLAGIQQAWPRLEALVGDLRGHRFVGAFDQDAGWYRACVEVRDPADLARLDLPEWVIPGGRYLRARLRGEPPAVYELIAPTYQSLEGQAERDSTRPSLEIYRRRDAIDLLLPVR